MSSIVMEIVLMSTPKIALPVGGKLQVGTTPDLRDIIELNVQPILLFDGVCGLCNRLVRFILRQDRAQVFRFAALQSPFAVKILTRHGVNPAALDTFYVVLNHDPKAAILPAERLLSRSDAVIFILSQLGGLWRCAGPVFAALPGPLRDWIYRLISRNRYRMFGRYDTCPIPGPDVRARFLDA